MSPASNRELEDRLKRVEGRAVGTGSGTGTVKSVNEIGPDGEGNVDIDVVSPSELAAAIAAITPDEPLGGAPNGIAFFGDSFVADLLDTIGTRITEGQTAQGNGERGWPNILRRRYGFEDWIRRVNLPGTGGALNSLTWPLFTVPFHGSVHSVYFAPLTPVTGSNTNGRTLSVGNQGAFNVFCAELALTAGHDLGFGANLIPKLATVDADIVRKGQLLYWLSLKTNGAGLADNGGALEIHINGGDASNYGVAGSCLASAHSDRGWGACERFMTARALRGAGTRTAVQLVSGGKIDASLIRSGIAVHSFGFNDLRQIKSKAAWQESMRHELAACSWQARYTCSDVVGGGTITENAGSGGGTFGVTTGVPYIGYQGVRRYFAGTVGATKPKVTYAVPADFNGEPVDLCFYSETARAETITIASVSGGVANLSGPIPNFSADDNNKPIAWAGSTSTMLVASSTALLFTGTAPTPGTYLATIGRAGGAATITVDGAALDFDGGVRVNGAQSASVNTDRVYEGIFVGDVFPVAIESVLVVPVTKRITGLSPGAHTITVTIDAMGPGPARFWLNGWAREAPEVAQVWNNLPVTPAMTGPERALVPSYNAWSVEVLAEFPAVRLADVHAVISPDGVPIPSMFIGDGIHPGFKGAQVYADVVDQAIQSTPSRLLAAS